MAYWTIRGGKSWTLNRDVAGTFSEGIVSKCVLFFKNVLLFSYFPYRNAQHLPTKEDRSLGGGGGGLVVLLSYAPAL